jgi:DUF1365 family protein
MAHRFDYPASLLMLPMRTLRERPAAALPRNRFGWMSFHDRDHGDGREDSLAWLDELLARHGIDDARGEVWLHCFPRVLGWAFKPVSFWYAERRDRSLAAIVVEVNNTFGRTSACRISRVVSRCAGTLDWSVATTGSRRATEGRGAIAFAGTEASRSE